MPVTDPCSLDFPLYRFTPEDAWTLGDAVQGVQVFGATGSGKTSGSGRALAHPLLRAGYGGLVLCAKPDEAELWLQYARETNRSADLCIVRPGGEWRFNFVEYELLRTGAGAGVTLEIANVLATASETGTQTSSRDPYWDLAARELVINAVELSVMAGLKLSLPNLLALIRGAPPSLALASDVWSGSGDSYNTKRLWGRILGEAHRRVTDDPERFRDFELMRSYWLSDLPSLAPQTRSSVVSTLTTKLAGLVRAPLRQLLSTDSTVKPADCRAGKIIVLDIPVKEFGETGRLAQVIFKTAWQRDVERHIDKSRPVFLWADESQYFCTRHDMLFQQTARSARCVTVYLTQNLPNYYAMMDGGNSTSITDSLMGNLQTKIFHANGDPTTNEWAERVFGFDLQDRACVPGHKFSILSKGAAQGGFVVGSYVFQGGRTWSKSGGRNFLFHEFKQAKRS